MRKENVVGGRGYILFSCQIIILFVKCKYDIIFLLSNQQQNEKKKKYNVSLEKECFIFLNVHVRLNEYLFKGKKKLKIIFMTQKKEL